VKAGGFEIDNHSLPPGYGKRSPITFNAYRSGTERTKQ